VPDIEAKKRLLFDKPDPSLKGKRGGNCNREACQRPGATWFNKTMNAYYCPSCAERINEVPQPDGKPLCVRCPELDE